MVQSLSELISRQEAIFRDLKLICTNYKKDSPTRKNLVYLEERLSRLNNNWEKFVHNHQLLEESGATDLQYFNDDIFNSTKKMYEDVLQDMLKRKSELPSASTSKTEPTPATPKQGKVLTKFTFDDIKFHVPPRGTSDATEKQQDLLRQQYCNFRALERTAEKITIALDVPMEKWELEDGLSNLKSKWEQIEKANWELDYILQDEDSNYQQKYNTVENLYDDLKRKLQHNIWNNAHYEKSTPKIQIPDFHGNYNQWLTFKDLYLESVHNNPILSKAQKMQHLKTKLKGEAEKLVQHLGISAENYASCWELLTHRYDNKRLLFTSYINTLLNQPNIQQPTAASIRKLHDVMRECLNGLKNIGLDITNWDPIVVHLLVQKLDSVTYNEYMKEIKCPREFPDLKEFAEFLESKFMSLEALQSSSQRISSSTKPWKSEKQPQKAPESRNNFYKNKTRGSSYFNKSQNSPKAFFTTAKTCPICKTNHILMNCEKFLAMNAHERIDTVRNLQLCKNCLYSHGEKQCKSRKTCVLCHKTHHTLIHEAETELTSNKNIPSSTPSTSYGVNNVTNEEKEVLLTTVLLNVKTIDGNCIKLRGLLDQGSQVSLITEDAAQRLRLQRRKVSAVVSGVGTLSGNCKGAVNVECQSIHSDYKFNFEALVMKRLISNLPTASFSISNWDYLENLKLADPQFNMSGPIDLLLGADIYSELILNGVIRSDQRYPVAQQTKVGWILCGNVRTFNCLVTLNDVENMARFWETEEIPEKLEPSSEEQYCEQHYNTTTKRLANGQYVVQMPMKPNFEENLNNARSQALAQFLQLERKMLKNEGLSQEYKRFMSEYIAMGHMHPITGGNRDHHVYLPHHGVLRSESTTTKLRVVFNASYKAKGHSSLNDHMYCGPNLQKDILTLLINWRTYRYVFTADVEKLYRFIWLNENQRYLQTVIWRSSPNEPLQDWQLGTVTYGTKSAPYLAMRTLHKLADDEKDSYPDAANVLKNFFYMDDLVYGQDTIDASKTLVTQLIQLLKKGGFNLRKWKSNEPSILEHLRDDQKSRNTNIDFSPEQTTNSKMLGMRWNQESDSFTYQWDLPIKEKLTKRILLSEISKLYDPLGLLSPVTIKTKLLFQKIWISKIDWEDSLPDELAMEWETMRKDIPLLSKLSIPRWLQCKENNLEIHGFCDASEKAYACVIYSRVQNQAGEYKTTLITAKTKVAPISNKITVPRMELCATVLLAKLLEKVQITLGSKNLHVRCWSDSKVVLAWLQGDVNRWDKYVANRVKQVNNIISASCWSYVKSEENPADCATRGLTSAQLLEYKLWWNGPNWLKANTLNVDQDIRLTYTTNAELQENVNSCAVTYKTCEIINTLLNNNSSYKRVIRVLGWILRLSNIRKQKRIVNVKKNIADCGDKRMVMCLSPQDIMRATELVIKNVQQESYGDEIECLTKNQPISTKSNLLKLTPFLDDSGILRVKGRLGYSTLSAEAKHPVILPATGRLTELLIQEAHRDTLHGGARLTLAHLRQKFWIIGGSRTVKKELRQCIRCHRFKPSRNVQLMADLPKERVTPSRPFTNTGVDYTGHVDVKINKGRGVKTCKAYIAIFICMVTKAVHLELVSDLTTQTFLAAFKRMCARRGTPRHVFSDNGTNFVGAAKLLQQEFSHHKTFETSEFIDEMSNLQIEWHFNAPLWPTAGGLWEAAVKSMKYHLHRVLGEQKLTFEQFTTLLHQIEACLNSRPLCPLTEDIEDLEYLTPGHFLIGGPLLSPPQREQDFAEHDLRNRWRLVEQMNAHIWKRWSSEYLQQLQIRSKWQHPKENLQQGSLVLVKDEHVPPGHWAVGRVQELHPGADGKVRVVTLKTRKGLLKRPITKLSPLPLKLEESRVNEAEAEKMPTPEPRQRGGRTKSKNWLSLVLLSVLAMTTIAQTAPTTESFKVSHIPSNHPIYFDEAGKIQLIHDEWTLLVYYNLTSYWQATDRIKDYVIQIDKLCQRISHEYAPCKTIVGHLRHELSHLADYNSMLLTQHSRPKRGYFDGVGKLSRTLFGVLDADFAEKYEKDIQKLQMNDNYLLQLMKNQTLIVEAENNVIKRNTAFMDQQFEILRSYMNETCSDITKIENKAHMLFTMNDINSAAVTSTLILSDLNRILEMLMNAIANIYRGHLDTHLFPANELIEQLNIISGRLPQGLSLPIKDIQKDLKNIYDIIHVKARITNNYMLFEIHIPLLSDEDYKIYRVIPIPFLRQGHLKRIQPSSSFIAINFVKNSYIMMEDQDMHQCTSYGEGEFICVSRNPIYNMNNKDAPCEAQAFNQQESLSCVLSDVTCKETWTKLHKSNMWLFTLCAKQLMRIICDDQVTPAVIDGTGVITLKSKCLLQKKDATIFTHNQLGSRIYMGPEIEVPTVNSTINSIFDLGWKNAKLNITVLDTPTAVEIRKIDQQLEFQKSREILPKPSDMSSHDIYLYSVTSLLLGGIAVLALYRILKRWRKTKKVSAKPGTISPRGRDNFGGDIELQEIPSTAAEPIYSEARQPKTVFHFDDVK